jgi:hypothetical protein
MGAVEDRFQFLVNKISNTKRLASELVAFEGELGIRGQE